MEEYKGMEMETIRFKPRSIITGSGDPPELPNDPL